MKFTPRGRGVLGFTCMGEGNFLTYVELSPLKGNSLVQRGIILKYALCSIHTTLHTYMSVIIVGGGHIY